MVFSSRLSVAAEKVARAAKARVSREENLTRLELSTGVPLMRMNLTSTRNLGNALVRPPA